MEIGIGSRIKHKQFGVGVIVQVKTTAFIITFIESGTKAISREVENELEIIDATVAAEDIVSLQDVEKSLAFIIKRYADIQETVQIGTKWTGGSLILQPGDKSLKEKVIPIDAFFHKIVMIRDRLRTLEQRVNASNMTDEEKVNIQQYITRIYGSLTSFNVLFKRPEDYFIGDKSE
jgi:hypothetical protein